MPSPKQIAVPGGGYLSVSEQTVGKRLTGRFTAMLVLGGSVVHTAEGLTAARAILAVGTWLHGLNAGVSEIAMKLRYQEG